ncbi:hypothetical protein WR25_14722 [Diploscapter pachys]|uniref:Uncharacterized protein n=1 Tax=Diploscapter pachys TaxID=2018661 RepID=A0A2A2J9Z7_9BILA|nr:hypothetical protein WR25_14722 [Diploscapter pachys]
MQRVQSGGRVLRGENEEKGGVLGILDFEIHLCKSNNSDSSSDLSENVELLLTAGLGLECEDGQRVVVLVALAAAQPRPRTLQIQRYFASAWSLLAPSVALTKGIVERISRPRRARSKSRNVWNFTLDRPREHFRQTKISYKGSYSFTLCKLTLRMKATISTHPWSGVTLALTCGCASFPPFLLPFSVLHFPLLDLRPTDCVCLPPICLRRATINCRSTSTREFSLQK